MSKEKQIEEMWNIITTECNNECVGCEYENDDWCFTHRVINNLYNAGYRKQSENLIAVVRCCDCKYCEVVIDSIIDEPKYFCTRMVGSIPIDPTDYCSRAKMKGGE